MSVESQRRKAITVGGYKVVLNWFEWNLHPSATQRLATRWRGTAAHWLDPNLFDRLVKLPLRLWALNTRTLSYLYGGKWMRQGRKLAAQLMQHLCISYHFNFPFNSFHYLFCFLVFPLLSCFLLYIFFCYFLTDILRYCTKF
jgi:hypothetical protein